MNYCVAHERMHLPGESCVVEAPIEQPLPRSGCFYLNAKQWGACKSGLERVMNLLIIEQQRAEMQGNEADVRRFAAAFEQTESALKALNKET